MEERRLLAHYESQENWAVARRGVLVRKVVCAFKNCSVDLIPFEEVRTRLHLTRWHTPLYVQDYDPATQEVRVVAAFGRTDWYQNICVTPAVEVQIGRERFKPDQRLLSIEEIAELERRFRRHHPIVARSQCWLMDWPWRCSEEEFLAWASTLRGVVFRPQQN